MPTHARVSGVDLGEEIRAQIKRINDLRKSAQSVAKYS